MNAELHNMTENELAEWQYAHRHDLDSDEGEQVEIDISPHLSVTVSFRLPGVEADAIREAAHDAGLSLSEWIRQACSEALDPDEPARSRRTVQSELHTATRELNAIARRLEDTARK